MHTLALGLPTLVGVKQKLYRFMNSFTLRTSIRLALVALALGCYNLFAAEPAGRTKELNNTPASNVDLERYQGRWYELVRKPHSFEKGMSHVVATYTLRPDGKIDVTNEGIKKGKRKVSRGKARTTDIPGQLMVTFFIFPGEYNILEVAPDYSYSVVGGGSPKYLWVLSRTPSLPKETMDGIFARLRDRGYDLSDIIIVEQDQ